ncbi:ABC transporter ATP-binding protein [Lysinibacter sp. HNR]|uniref:ABC transporter ATP-binding protein n=1 Tax=Lysinibacter sp. HNR TaxID=3031408 RepID=UPI00243515A0|nr:ABC transporter ATP-binding protein [Lysinibacter sp. HNR]WGD36521.1 ABC transporter ATP-binding protein [Lysinibacter sp. HNR]
MSAAVETQGLTKKFGSRLALRGVNLNIPRGGVFGVIGPNGAGKTTTMRILLDVMRPTSGRVRVLGESPRGGGISLRRRIGYLPGELILEGRVTGHALLEHYTRISGTVRPGMIASLTERLNLDLNVPVRSLSKGNKQKLGIIQAFMHQPELLVLDEPTSGLDPLVQQIFLDLVREARDAGQTVFLSSHVLSEIEQVADEVAILRAGHVVATSTVERLRAVARRRIRALVAIAPEPQGVDVLEHIHTLFSSLPELRDLQVSREPVSSLTPATSPDSTDSAGSADSPGLLSITGSLAGDPDTFLKTIARLHVHDISIETPNLEDAVLTLYSESDAEITSSLTKETGS